MAEAKYKTQFAGWNGKQQRSQFIDASGWHACYNSNGGSCGSRSLTTGTSACITRGFSIGGDFDVSRAIGGMKIKADYKQQWTSCNTRAETITCSPKPGWKGRAAVLFGERVGTLRVVGTHIPRYDTWGKTCARGYWADRGRDPDAGTAQCVWDNQSWTTSGYLPEFRYSTCDYQRI
jgi:hypothetical protein